MALSPQLLNFKSSGVYRLEFDKSQTANINVETLNAAKNSALAEGREDDANLIQKTIDIKEAGDAFDKVGP